MISVPPHPDAATTLLCSLASGSRGNSTYLFRDGHGLLVDVGLSARQTELRMRARGLDPASVEAMVLTHEHGDHARGVRVFARRFGVPVYVQEAARPHVRLDGVGDVRTFSGDRPFQVPGFEIHPFSIPHDTVEPVAFVVDDGHQSVGIATDMGMPTRLTVERLRRCRAVILEANHDLQMLMEGPYPWWLKQRVRGRLGHLNNDDAMDVLRQIADGGVEVALMGHLSQENNRPDLVHALALERLARAGHDQVAVAVLAQAEPGPVIALGDEVVMSDAQPQQEVTG